MSKSPEQYYKDWYSEKQGIDLYDNLTSLDRTIISLMTEYAKYVADVSFDAGMNRGHGEEMFGIHSAAPNKEQFINQLFNDTP
jgi:hypothetical protein